MSEPTTPAEHAATVPEIRDTWERVRAALPPANPTDPDDPLTNLDTLAAIAHAKWTTSIALAARAHELERYCYTQDWHTEWYVPMRRRAERAEAALRFYADADNYDTRPLPGTEDRYGVPLTACPIEDDCGEAARAALGEQERKP